MVDHSAKVHCSDWRAIKQRITAQSHARVAFITTERPMSARGLCLVDFYCDRRGAIFCKTVPFFWWPKRVPGGRPLRARGASISQF